MTSLSPRRTLSRTHTFWLTVVAYLALMISASTPSPLYVVYQAKWHFPTSTLTVVFGVYALALLVSLLTVGGLSDFVGRRPVLLAGLSLLAASMVVFAFAQGVAWLYVARVMQGLAAGAAIGTLSAGIIDLAPEGRAKLAALLNALIPSVGLGAGALIAGAFAEFAPHPTVLVYAVMAGVLAAVIALVVFAAEPETRRSGALASLAPRMRIAAHARGAFLRVSPSLVATWAQMGLTLSLLVSLAAVQFGVTNHFESGALVLLVCLAATIAGFGLRDAVPTRANNIGAVLLIAGIAITLLSLRENSLGTFIAGDAVGGLGLGAAMSGAIRILSGLPHPHERGEFFAGVYVVGYLAFSIPAVAAGFAAVHFGLRDVTYVYGAGVIVLALAVLVLSSRSARPAAAPVVAEPVRSPEPVGASCGSAAASLD